MAFKEAPQECRRKQQSYKMGLHGKALGSIRLIGENERNGVLRINLASNGIPAASPSSACRESRGRRLAAMRCIGKGRRSTAALSIQPHEFACAENSQKIG